MENINLAETPTKKNTIRFVGKGSELFAIDLVNTVLTILTLGLYYPWAKARKLKYVYQHTELAGTPFDFLGTGREIFRGFIKAYLILATIYIAFMLVEFFPVEIRENEVAFGVFIGFLLLLYFVVIPFFVAYAFYGTFRYRSARSSWRGILAGFEVEKKSFIKTFLKMYYLLLAPMVLLLSIMIPLVLFAESNSGGSTAPMIMLIVFCVLYIPIMILYLYLTAYYQSTIYKLTYGNLRLGDLKLNFKGTTSELFGIMIVGGILTSLTMGIYYFWYRRDLYNFLIKNLYLEQNGVEHRVKSDISGGKVFRLEAGNFFLVLFTAGLGYSWAYCRTARFIANNVIIPEEIDLDSIKQTETAYTDATGEELGDLMDMGGIFF